MALVSAVPHGQLYRQARALLDTVTLVSTKELARQLGVTTNNLSGSLRQRVITGDLVREVGTSATGVARAMAFYRLPTPVELAARAAINIPEPVLVAWHDPFALCRQAAA